LFIYDISKQKLLQTIKS